MEKILQDNGYKAYNAECPWEYYKTLYQKCIMDKEGNKLYYINFYMYEKTFEVHLQFEIELCAINISLFAFDKDVKLKDIEKKVHEIWESFGCPAYEG